MRLHHHEHVGDNSKINTMTNTNFNKSNQKTMLPKKVNFLPVSEVIPPSRDHVTTIDRLDDFAWYVPQIELHNHVSKKKIGFLTGGAVKHTAVETQTLYFCDLKNHLQGLIQIVYSNILGGIYKGFQIDFKIFSHKTDVEREYEVWETCKLENAAFSNNSLSVKGNNITFEFRDIPNKKNLNDDDKLNLANLKIKIKIIKLGLKLDLRCNLGKGFKIDPDGCSFYLDKSVSNNDVDWKNYIGKKYMRHQFIPNGICNGTLEYLTKNTREKRNIELSKTPVLYIDAVQGLLPNKAAKRWNFLYFQSFSYTIVLMEYLTLPEYDETKVTIWSVSKDDEIIDIGSSTGNDKIVKFDKVEQDKQNGWEYPTGMTFNLLDDDNELVVKNMNLVNRYDILGELPHIVRKLASSIAHIKPYLYQYCQPAEYRGEEGVAIIESTFIS